MTGRRTPTCLLATATGPTSEENGKSKKSPGLIHLSFLKKERDSSHLKEKEEKDKVFWQYPAYSD